MKTEKIFAVAYTEYNKQGVPIVWGNFSCFRKLDDAKKWISSEFSNVKLTNAVFDKYASEWKYTIYSSELCVFVDEIVKSDIDYNFIVFKIKEVELT
jgi:hypothetical protein